MKLMINNVRPGFLKCFRPEVPQGGGEPKFGTKLVIPKDHPQIAQIEKAMLDVAEAKWPGKGKAIFDKMVKTGKPKNIEVPFVREAYAKNGDQDDVYDGFEDAFYFSCSAGQNKRPLVLDKDKTVLVEQDGRPYSGCKANVQVELWAQDNNFGKAIRAEFKAIQFVADGDSFAGGTPANPDDFDDLGEGADAGDLA